MDNVNQAIEQAHKLLDKNRKPYIVYLRNKRIGLMSLQEYLDLDLDARGAKRMCTITKNALGKTI